MAACFGSPVQLPPHMKCKDVLYFTFKDRLTRRKRKEAYNDVQKACYTRVLSVPMVTQCECVTVVREMVLRDCELHYLPQEFLLTTVRTCWFWSRDQRYHCDWASNGQSSGFVCFLVFVVCWLGEGTLNWPRMKIYLANICYMPK